MADVCQGLKEAFITIVGKFSLTVWGESRFTIIFKYSDLVIDSHK